LIIISHDWYNHVALYLSMHGMQPTDRASLGITDARKPSVLNYLLAGCFSRLKSTIISHTSSPVSYKFVA